MKKIDVVAGGQNVVSCANSGSGYRTLSGTSMATPAVSGATAILLSAHPELIGKPEEIFKRLRETATPIKTRNCSSKQDHPNNVFGYGIVNCEKLIE